MGFILEVNISKFWEVIESKSNGYLVEEGASK